MKAILRVLALGIATMLSLAAPAYAITGGMPASGKDGLRRSVVRIENSLGEICSGVLVAPDVVLTAAHCVAMPARYRAITLDDRFRPRVIAVTSILKHPSFIAGTTPHDQPGTDLALVLLERNVSDGMAPALISTDRAITSDIELFIAGYGTSSYGNKRSVSILRVAAVVVLATGQPPNNLVVAADRRLLGRSPGASACLGDSGGPALIATAHGFAVGGIISWAAGPLRAKPMTPCGGTTAITPLSSHSGWIAEGIERLHWH